MHLFLFDLFISVDNLAPIIKVLKSKKIIILNINPIQNYKKNPIVKLLLKSNIGYFDYLPVSFHKTILFFFLKVLLILPCFIINKLYFLWYYIYKNFHFSSKKNIENFLISKKIKTISYEESAPKFIIKIFSDISKKHNLKLIKIASGLRTAKLNKMGKEQLSLSDYYLSPNKVRGEKKNEITVGQIKYFGSLRFSIPWMNKIRKLFKLKKTKSDKLNIGVFKKHFSSERLRVNELVNKLTINKRYNLKTREKPRDINPLKCAKFNNDDLSSSQLIDWSDIIITSRSSSMLIEASIKKKKIILLEFLNSEIKKSGIYKFKFLLKAKNFKNLEYLLNKSHFIRKSELKKFVNKFLIDFYNYKKVKDKYINFYKSLE